MRNAKEENATKMLPIKHAIEKHATYKYNC